MQNRRIFNILVSFLHLGLPPILYIKIGVSQAQIGWEPLPYSHPQRTLAG